MKLDPNPLINLRPRSWQSHIHDASMGNVIPISDEVMEHLGVTIFDDIELVPLPNNQILIRKKGLLSSGVETETEPAKVKA